MCPFHGTYAKCSPKSDAAERKQTHARTLVQ